LGWASSAEDVEQFLAAWAELYERTRRTDGRAPERQDSGNALASSGSPRYQRSET
jgi:hypothetical protein